MPKNERIPFDFTGAAGSADIDKLEDILRAGHWSSSGLITGLLYKNEPTLLLLDLLQTGGVALYKCEYSSQDDISPEIRQRAEDFNTQMNKRDIGYPLLDIARLFHEHEFDRSKTVYNSLFFPELNAYVRCGSIAPDRLIEMLERDGCDKVILFPSAKYEGESFYHIFMRAMPRDSFMDALEAMRERTLSAMREALQRAEERVTFPSFPSAEMLADKG